MSNTPPKTIFFKTMLYFDAPKYVERHGQGHETLFFPKDKIIIIIKLIIISLKNLNSKPSYSSFFSHPKKWDIGITC
jgi:hypothetical protein